MCNKKSAKAEVEVQFTNEKSFGLFDGTATCQTSLAPERAWK